MKITSYRQLLPRDLILFIAQYLSVNDLTNLHHSHPVFWNIHLCRAILLPRFPRKLFPIINPSKLSGSSLSTIVSLTEDPTYYDSQRKRVTKTESLIKRTIDCSKIFGSSLSLTMDGELLFIDDSPEQFHIGMEQIRDITSPDCSSIFFLTKERLWENIFREIEKADPDGISVKSDKETSKVSHQCIGGSFRLTYLDLESLPEAIFDSWYGIVFIRDQKLEFIDYSYEPCLYFVSDVAKGIEILRTIVIGNWTYIHFSDGSVSMLESMKLSPILDHCLDIGTIDGELCYINSDTSLVLRVISPGRRSRVLGEGPYISIQSNGKRLIAITNQCQLHQYTFCDGEVEMEIIIDKNDDPIKALNIVNI